VGPSGVLLALSNNVGVQIATKKTTENGFYSFENLAASTYFISAQESTDGLYQISKDHNLIKCEISYSKSLVCQGEIIISGFSIKGNILNQNQPLENFFIFLYPSEKKAINFEFHEKKITEHPLKDKDYICYVKSDNMGQFSFQAIPPGDYQIAIKSFELEKKIDIEPSFQTLAVKNEPVSKIFSFEVNKFTISGNVVDGKGNGVAGVKISLDGEVKAVSDENGKYTLEKVDIQYY
jgi:hypothetical protein